MNLPELMDLAVSRRASDVHLAPERSPALRIDGALGALLDEFPPLSAEECETAILGILRPDQIEALERTLEIDLSYSLDLPHGTTRFRVNVHQQQRGLAAIFRLIPDDIPSPEALTMEQSIFKFAALPRGLVLFTGATGTGKSTTLACLIDQINQRSQKHILTVEDPIEYTYSEKRACITQRELGIHTHGFAPALKSALREDPDVILVGEMRDLETIQLALTASETGHLVFSTVHTSDTSQTVDRIIDVFPPAQQALVRAQLASVLQGIVTQVLLPRASGSGRIAAREILLATPRRANDDTGRQYPPTLQFTDRRSSGGHVSARAVPRRQSPAEAHYQGRRRGRGQSAHRAARLPREHYVFLLGSRPCPRQARGHGE